MTPRTNISYCWRHQDTPKQRFRDHLESCEHVLGNLKFLDTEHFRFFGDRQDFDNSPEIRPISQCAARLTRHRAFYFGYLADKWGNSKIKYKGMQTKITKNVMADRWARTKSKQKSIPKPWKIIKSSVWDHPRGLWGEAHGPVWPQSGPGLEKDTKKATKN